MRTCLVALVIAATLAGAASAAGPPPPGPPGGLGKVSLSPLPKVGTAEFFRVTVTGTVTGASAPRLILASTNTGVLTGNMVAAAVESTPTVKAGTATAVFVIALFNPKKPIRRLNARQDDALDMIVLGSASEWGVPVVKEQKWSCQTAALYLAAAHLIWGNYFAGGTFNGKTAAELVKLAEALSPGC